MNSPLKFNVSPLPTFSPPVSSPLRLEIDQFMQNLRHCYPHIAFQDFKPRKNATPRSLKCAFQDYKNACQLLIDSYKQMNEGVIVAPQEEKHVHFFEPIEISKALPLPVRVASPEKPVEPFSIKIPIEEDSQRIKSIENDLANFKDVVAYDIQYHEKSINCLLDEIKAFKTLEAGHLTVESDLNKRLEKIEHEHEKQTKAGLADLSFGIVKLESDFEKRIAAIEERNKKLDEEPNVEKVTPDNAGYFNIVDLSVNDLLTFDFSKMSKLCKAKFILDLEAIISNLKN